MNKFLNYFTLHYFYVTIFKSEIFISKAFERSIKIMDILKGYGKIYVFFNLFHGLNNYYLPFLIEGCCQFWYVCGQSKILLYILGL